MLYGRLDDTGGAASLPTYMGPQAAPPAAPSAGVTAAAPQPQAPGSITMGGYTPDYKGLIENDPAYLASKTAASAAGSAAEAARRARIRSLYVQYGGELPDGFQDQFGDIDQATKTAGQANQNSAIARLHTNYQQGLEQFRRQLAARGALQSGDLSYGEDQLNRGYGQGQYDAANQFLGDAGSAYGDYLGVTNQNAQGMASAIGQAESNVYSNPAYRPSDPVTATLDAASSATYGKPLYKHPDGSLYTQDGNPFDPEQDAYSAASGINIGFRG